MPIFNINKISNEISEENLKALQGKYCIVTIYRGSFVNENSKDNQSWTDFINDHFGPLYGYAEDLKNSSLDAVLDNFFAYKVIKEENAQTLENDIKRYNFDSAKNAYLIYLESYIKTFNPNTEKYKAIKTDIDICSYGSNDTKSFCTIAKKYGIVDNFDLIIPYSKITQDYGIITGENRYVKADNSTVEDIYRVQRQETVTNIDYAPLSKSKDEAKTFYTDLNLQYRVLVLSKMTGTLYDISKYLSSVNTSVTIAAGGNFELKAFLFDRDNLNDNSKFHSDLNVRVGYAKALQLQNLFKENDLVFIKYETLKIEGEDYDYQNYAAESRGNKIAGKFWDMIGLIDTTSINSDPFSITLNISGRDLIKLLIEDNNIFIPYLFANDAKTTFGGTQKAGLNRLFATGENQNSFVYARRSLETTIGYIFSALTHIKILDDKSLKLLYQEYGDTWGKEFSYDSNQRVNSSKKIEGIWGLIQFYVDRKVSHYRVWNEQLLQPDGSMYELISSLICSPLTELICDTFNDKYDIIVRRPPFCEEEIREANWIVIDPALCLSDSLSFDNEVYTTFQLTPQGLGIGSDKNLALAYLPMVLLDKYIDIWGIKTFNVTSNYIDANVWLENVDNDKKDPKYTYIDDFIRIIETMAVKPFTRKGTITMRGDRRIKVGDYVYYLKTNEVFYVEGVGQSISIEGSQANRLTTLNVSRGMVRDYIFTSNKKENTTVGNETVIKDKLPQRYKKETSAKQNAFSIKDNYIDSTNNSSKIRNYNISYFNLIAKEYIRESLIRNLNANGNKKGSFTLKRQEYQNDKPKDTQSVVISQVFDFFLNGKQFEN